MLKDETTPDASRLVARRGKIARLPLTLREQVNARLLQGAPGRKILAWLNALPETKTVLAEDDGQPINDANLSAWRHGGYAEWLARRERIERTRELAAYAAQQTKANGSTIAEGGASIAAGKLLELLETVDNASGERLDTKALGDIVAALAALRAAEQNDVRLAQNKQRLTQKDAELALAREKFQRETCAMFLKWHADQQALNVANGEGSNDDKIARLGQLMFGETWKAP